MVGIQCSMQHFKFMYFLHFHCYFYVARSWKAERPCWQNIEWNLGKSYQLIIWIWIISKAENCLYVFPSNFGTLGPSRFRFNHTLLSSTRKKKLIFHFVSNILRFSICACSKQTVLKRAHTWAQPPIHTRAAFYTQEIHTHQWEGDCFYMHMYASAEYISNSLTHTMPAAITAEGDQHILQFTHTHANTHTHAHPRSTALLCTNTGQNKQNKHTYDNYTNTMNEIATPKHWQCRNTQWRNKKREKRRNKKRREKKMKHK